MKTNTSPNETCPETGKSKKCPCSCKKIGAVVLALLVFGAMCCHIHHPRTSHSKSDILIDLQPGTMCTVQFRRDALGSLTSLVSPTTNSLNGTMVSMQGELIAVDHDAILLDQVNEHYIVNGVPKMKRFWIPKNSILSIEYEPVRNFRDLPQDNYLRIQHEAKKTQRDRETPND